MVAAPRQLRPVKEMIMNDTERSADLAYGPQRSKPAPADGSDYAAAVSEGWPVAADPCAGNSGKDGDAAPAPETVRSNHASITHRDLIHERISK